MCKHLNFGCRMAPPPRCRCGSHLSANFKVLDSLHWHSRPICVPVVSFVSMCPFQFPCYQRENQEVSSHSSTDPARNKSRLHLSLRSLDQISQTVEYDEKQGERQSAQASGNLTRPELPTGPTVPKQPRTLVNQLHRKIPKPFASFRRQE